MKISIDVRGINWYHGTGIGTYTQNVLKNILSIDNTNYYHLYWSGENFEKYERENVNTVLSPKRNIGFFKNDYIPNDLLRNNIDIYHVPQNGIGLSPNITCAKVITLHDLIPYIMPETVGRGYLNKFLKEMPYLVENSDGIITVSEWSKKDIIRFFSIDEDKVYVTPLAADEKYKPLDKEKCRNTIFKTYEKKGPYILYIGGFSKRKNVDSLIKAFGNVFKKLYKKYTLIIAGGIRDQKEYYMEICKEFNITENVLFTGFVEEDILPVLYNGSDAFVYPSFYEGFGLPPLEAMSCSVPVITSLYSSMEEVVGDTALSIDPHNIKSLENALLKLLNNESLMAQLSTKGYERSKNFSWENTSKKTLEIYSKVYEKSKVVALI